MTTKAKPKSRLLETVRIEGARDLNEAGFIDKRRMHEFDALCLTPIPAYTKERIRALRGRYRISGAVLAAEA